jgi:ubiquitin carboxyl-terminal hydrolase 36/42
MRQDVTCLRCKYVSTTFQHSMDLLLDIRQVSNIEDALQQHFKQERIGGNSENADSMYKCEKCHVKVPAKKQSLIEQPPAVLCIQLKRFSLLGGKISKPVQLSRIINMKQFINTSGHGASTTDVQYKLVSMITHVGPSPNCGHYTAIGEAANGQFFQFDDSSVRPISVGQAMNTASYVVFYEMTKPSWERRLNPNASTPITPTGVLSTNGTAKPSSQVGPSINGVARPSPQIGPKVIAQPGSQMASIKPKLISTISSHATPVINKLGVVATALKRNIISAAANTSTPATTNSTSSTNGTLITPTKPIAATSTSSSATNTKLPTLAKITNGHVTPIKNGGLVPYDDDSDSESPPNNSSKEATKSTSIKPEFSTVPRSVNVGLDKVVAVQEPKASLPTEAGHTVPVAVHKSASGTWHITDVDHHNPSIASDGSCGSTSGKWIVTPAPANNVRICEGPKATSPWTVTPLLKKSLLALEPVQKLSEQAIDDPNYPIEPVSRVKEPVLVRVMFPVTQARKRGSMDDSDGDDYDAEFDRGRTKKVRKAIIAPSNSFNSQDPMVNNLNALT